MVVSVGVIVLKCKIFVYIDSSMLQNCVLENINSELSNVHWHPVV